MLNRTDELSVQGRIVGSDNGGDKFFIRGIVSHSDSISLGNLGVHNQVGKIVFDILLDGTLQGAGAILGVVAFFRNEVFGFLRDIKGISK